ncbi:hypothetical protein [Rubrivirga sp. IMCC45206]|uniref:hypothetical protein n=1 Tax=Rubrivirga sp. IMCC45206 TaxID=3391614 RepID=UPI00398FA65A
MRALVALLLTLLLVAAVSACDTTEPGCAVPAAVEAGRLAACVSGDVALGLDATLTTFRDDEGQVVIEFRDGRSGGTLVVSAAPAVPDLFPVAVQGPDGLAGAAFVVLTVDVPGTFDTFNGQSGMVTVESVGADGSLAGTFDVAAGSASGELRVRGRFRTLAPN